MADPLSSVNLSELMDRTAGRPEVVIGMIDGPVMATHPDLSLDIREIPGARASNCASAGSPACVHGTFVAGVLKAKRDSQAPAICPDCTLLVRPIFAETPAAGPPNATPSDLAAAILDCVDAGARLINISAAIAELPGGGEYTLQLSLDYAAGKGVLVVAAAGNQGTLGSTAITRHPWVIPVVAYDGQGALMAQSNIGSSIGHRGLGAPGVVTSLGAAGDPVTLAGTSMAAAIVTGTIALLWSEFGDASAVRLKLAVTQTGHGRRRAIVPPLLNAGAAYQILLRTSSG
jgi:subtilisin family serine protease